MTAGGAATVAGGTEGAAGAAAAEGTSRLAWSALMRTSLPGAVEAGAEGAGEVAGEVAGGVAGEVVAAVEVAGLGVEADHVAAPDPA